MILHTNDWEFPNTISKNGGPVGPTNHKRTLPASSSSPPLTQWAYRRHQKISRTTRRTNIIPVVTSNDDIPSLDSGTENGSGFMKRVSRLLSDLIPKEGKDNENNDTESNGYGSTFEDETDIKSNGFIEFSGVLNEPVCSILD
nr:hypothetical protein [Tanacetum cinerariifolium]